ncbi:MAG: glycoside hydrolase family 88 protein [Candidatus Micrarchaeia archaeon]
MKSTKQIDYNNLNRIISKMVYKVGILSKENENTFPYGKDLSSTEWVRTEHCDWSGGYWIGLLLNAYEETNDISFLDKIKTLLPKIDARLTDEDEFLGFIFYYSYAILYDKFRREEYKNAALKAANKLVSMYNHSAQMIPLGKNCKILGTAISGENIVGVDNAIIPNILLYWAYDKTKNQNYLEIAKQNLDSILNNLVRDNGSTEHMLEFDQSGKITKIWNNLGYKTGTTWARGLAWTLLSLVYAIDYFSEIKYLKLYIKSLKYYISKSINHSMLTYYDTEDPRIPNVPIDTTALTISAEAYILSYENGLVDGNMLPIFYRSIMENLDLDKNNDIILKHGCFDYPRNYLVDADLIFSDYYAMDFFIRLRKIVGRGDWNGK